MMQKKQFVIGLLLGLGLAFAGVYIFTEWVLKIDVFTQFSQIRQKGYLGKIITLGALLNLGLFFILLKKNQDMKARGVIFATLLLAILTVIL